MSFFKPLIASNLVETESKAKPGKIVNDFIKNAKQEVEEYKNDITRDVFGAEDVTD